MACGTPTSNFVDGPTCPLSMRAPLRVPAKRQIHSCCPGPATFAQCPFAGNHRCRAEIAATSSLLKRQHDVHTIAYVNPRAISAGAMIAMACDEIVMSDASMIGDCAPIAFKTDGSLEPMPVAERAKAESPIAADFYESAIRNH